MDGLALAIEKAGGIAPLARVLGISTQAISQWDRIPADRVIAIAATLDLKPNELRPDLYPWPDLQPPKVA